MSAELQPNLEVANATTGERGRLLGPFTRKGEKWWTIYWENGETTAEPEQGIA
jgi:hypothetical protein